MSPALEAACGTEEASASSDIDAGVGAAYTMPVKRKGSMTATPAEIELRLVPKMRFDVIDVTRVLSERAEGFFEDYRRALYCSFHTTAGYLEQSLCARLKHRPDSLHTFLRGFRRLFPPDADYRHDQMHLREELSEEQKRCEPRNADSHLTFIGSGLKNCVTYANRSDTPVYFIDLDGVFEKTKRKRKTSIIGYNHEEVVASTTFAVPVSRHAFDSVNLKDPRLGLFEMLQEEIDRHGVHKGRILISLRADEGHAGLTINEYESLLMEHDLAEVLRNPIGFMAAIAEKGKSMLRDPRSIPNKTVNFAKYDLVQVFNEFVDVLGISDSVVERMVERLLTVTANRFLRMERGVSLAVSDSLEAGKGAIQEGTYQSPILMQWNNAERNRRKLEITFTRLV